MDLGSIKHKLEDTIGDKLGSVGIHGPNTPIAIDLGTCGLKLLQVSNSTPPNLIAAAYLETPAELRHDASKRLEFQLAALPRLVKASGFKGKRAVCGIPAPLTYVKQIQAPKGDMASYVSAARGSIPEQLGCDASALVFRCYEAREAPGGKADIIAVAAARAMVEKLINAIRTSKLDPVGMHCEYAATLQAFGYLLRRESDAGVATLYLDIGAGSTRAIIANGKKIVFLKHIEIGGNTLDEVIAGQVQCSLEEAHAQRLAMTELVPAGAPGAEAGESGGLAMLSAGMAKASKPMKRKGDEERRGGSRAPGMSGDITEEAGQEFTPPRADLAEPLEILCDEVSMCLRYHESMFEGMGISKAVFVGGESRHVGLCQHIARRLNIPAQIGDPMARVARTGNEPMLGINLKSAQPGWTTALGLTQCPTDL